MVSWVRVLACRTGRLPPSRRLGLPSERLPSPSWRGRGRRHPRKFFVDRMLVAHLGDPPQGCNSAHCRTGNAVDSGRWSRYRPAWYCCGPTVQGPFGPNIPHFPCRLSEESKKMLTRLLGARGTRILGCLVMIALVLAVTGQVMAQEDGSPVADAAAQCRSSQIRLHLVRCVLWDRSQLWCRPTCFTNGLLRPDPATSGWSRSPAMCGKGANAYLRQQYMVVAGFFVVIVALAVVRGLRPGGAEQVCAVRLPDRRFLLRPGGLVRHEDGHLGQQPHRRRCSEIAEPGPAGRLPFRGGDGLDRRRPGLLDITLGSGSCTGSGP